NLTTSKHYLESKLSEYPGSLGTLVFKLRDQAGEKSLATSHVSGILNAPALNPLRRVFCCVLNAQGEK
ncbi:hypothetical protein LHK82_04000, partial [Escherichia coli]|nr:hypothetical protein [Escherichia coli]